MKSIQNKFERNRFFLNLTFGFFVFVLILSFSLLFKVVVLSDIVSSFDVNEFTLFKISNNLIDFLGYLYFISSIFLNFAFTCNF